MSGTIITITGGPRTGKSTLARLLSERLGATSFLEGEEKDFPPRIIEDIQTGSRTLELILWFRNKQVDEYLKALEVKRSGGIALLDTFWATNDMYIDEWVSDEFEKEILKDLAQTHYALLPWPDLILSLYSDKKTIREFATSGGRAYELNDDFLQKQVDLNNAHEHYFRKLNKPNIEFIRRSELDYFNKNHLDDLVGEVQKRLGI